MMLVMIFPIVVMMVMMKIIRKRLLMVNMMRINIMMKVETSCSFKISFAA